MPFSSLRIQPSLRHPLPLLRAKRVSYVVAGANERRLYSQARHFPSNRDQLRKAETKNLEQKYAGCLHSTSSVGLVRESHVPLLAGEVGILLSIFSEHACVKNTLKIRHLLISSVVFEKRIFSAKIVKRRDL